jgi:hypothetical protein
MKFRDWLCEIQQATYSNGRTALLLVDAKTGESTWRDEVQHDGRGETGKDRGDA